ncbi:MAG: 16S rRNA (guanine(527)-N(7))-methyltransferase RsmG [Roseobacter sp.]|jgi:16S rRNA (guanine527-N7)-methyltransferase|nr:16S rRNA (guanine(527)-N(7))-methyltransferase RsmG [Roseobacter sp.]
MSIAQDVSRETMDDLQRFHDLLVKWNARINLVSKSSIDNVWNRHIWDSYQVNRLAPRATKWADIGSGGGFPALVVAISAKHDTPSRAVVMVESDQRKAAFLRTAIRELSLNAEVFAERVESLPCLEADVISARALADLGALLGYAHSHLADSGVAFFMKGESWENEVEKARQTWSFDLVAHKSITSPKAAILEIKDIARV